MIKFSFHLCFKAILTVCLLAGVSLSTPAEETELNEIERLIEKYKSSELEIHDAYGVKNFTFQKDACTILFEEGYFITDEIEGQAGYIGVFLGKGKMTVIPPEKGIENQFGRAFQWIDKAASKNLISNMPFTDATFTLSKADYRRLRGLDLSVDEQVKVIEKGQIDESMKDKGQKLLHARRNQFQSKSADALAALMARNTLNSFEYELPFDIEVNSDTYKTWIGFSYDQSRNRECRIYERKIAPFGGVNAYVSRYRVSFDKQSDYEKLASNEGRFDAINRRLMEDKSETDLIHVEADLTIHTAGLRSFTKATIIFKPRLEGLRVPAFGLTSHNEKHTKRIVNITKLEDGQGNALSFYHDWGFLLVDYGKALPVGKEAKLVIELNGEFVIPIDPFIPSDDLDITLFSQIDFLPSEPSTFQPMHFVSWYPLGGGSWDAHSIHWIVRVPKPLLPVASGYTKRIWEEGDFNCLETELPPEEADSLPGFIFGRYNMFSKTFDDITINVFALQRQRGQMESIADEAINIINFYQEVFDEPLPFRELDLVQMSFFMGFAQAPAGFIQLTGEVFAKQSEMVKAQRLLYGGSGSPGFVDFTQTVLAHEMGHEWWGHIQVPQGGGYDNWLSEAFAEYASAMYQQWKWKQIGYKGKDFFKTQKMDWREYCFQVDDKYQGSIYLAPQSYSAPTQWYRKGPYLLNMLRAILGDDLFVDVLRDALKNGKADGATTSIEFWTWAKQTVADHWTEIVGPYMADPSKLPPELMPKVKRLQPFFTLADDWFEDWYVDEGHAHVDFSSQVTPADGGGYLVTCTVKQDPENFKIMYAPIAAFKKDVPLGSIYFWIDKPDFTATFKVPEKPTSVKFDPDEHMLAEVTVKN